MNQFLNTVHYFFLKTCLFKRVKGKKRYKFPPQSKTSIIWKHIQHQFKGFAFVRSSTLWQANCISSQTPSNSWVWWFHIPWWSHMYRSGVKLCAHTPWRNFEEWWLESGARVNQWPSINILFTLYHIPTGFHCEGNFVYGDSCTHSFPAYYNYCLIYIHKLLKLRKIMSQN